MHLSLIVQPILHDTTGEISEENLEGVEESTAAMPGEYVHEHL
jgi:hypothetical protein